MSNATEQKLKKLGLELLLHALVIPALMLIVVLGVFGARGWFALLVWIPYAIWIYIFGKRTVDKIKKIKKEHDQSESEQ